MPPLEAGLCRWYPDFPKAFLMNEQSATGAHEMFSLFLEPTAVKATINGKSVAGKSFPRDWVGRNSTPAVSDVFGNLDQSLKNSGWFQTFSALVKG
jgi:hypothetical protein